MGAGSSGGVGRSGRIGGLAVVIGSRAWIRLRAGSSRSARGVTPIWKFDSTGGLPAAELITRVASLGEPRTTMGGVNLVVGFRPELWREAYPDDAQHALRHGDRARHDVRRLLRRAAPAGDDAGEHGRAVVQWQARRAHVLHASADGVVLLRAVDGDTAPHRSAGG